MLSGHSSGITTKRAEAAAELEELGFPALWLGGSPGVRHAVPLVEATSRLIVATGIQSIWDYEPAECLVTPEHTAQARAALGETPLPAPESKVVLDPDPDRARTTGPGASSPARAGAVWPTS